MNLMCHLVHNKYFFLIEYMALCILDKCFTTELQASMCFSDTCVPKSITIYFPYLIAECLLHALSSGPNLSFPDSY